MTKGYDPESSQHDCMQLDVLLAEYVDGTIDPVVREVFEELMAQEPEVADRVERLVRVRRWLCGLGCRCAAPPGFESRLKQHIEEESGHSEAGATNGLIYTSLVTLVVLTLLAGSAAYSIMMTDVADVAKQTEGLVPQRLQRSDLSPSYLDAAGGVWRISKDVYPWALSGAVMVSHGSRLKAVPAETLQTGRVEAIPLTVP